MAENKDSNPSDGLLASENESISKPEENTEESKDPAVSNTQPSVEDRGNSDDQQEYSEDKPPLHYLRNIVKKDPSLAMRLNHIRQDSLKEALARNLDSGNGWNGVSAPNRENFFRSSKLRGEDDWILRTCSVCGCITPEYLSESSSKIFCSEECILQRMALQSGGRKASIFEYFSNGELGMVEIRGEIVDDRAPCTVVLKEKQFVYNELNAFWKDPMELDSAEKGDDVLIKGENEEYLRALVLKVNGEHNYKVALIDYSIIVNVTHVYYMPPEMERTMSFGGVITFKAKKFPKGNYVKFRVKERRLFGVWLCSFLHSDGGSSDIYLEEWFPPMRVKVVPLVSEEIVVITHYLDAKTMYVRRMDNHWNDEYILYNNDVNIHAGTAMKFKSVPKIGEICCALNEKDGCFYRAVIREHVGNFVLVTFMDTGVDQETEIADLRYLPCMAKQTPAFCRLIRLKDVKLQSSQGAMTYLKGLATKNIELILKFTGTTPDEATLTRKYNGEIVNNVIHNFETPGWMRRNPQAQKNVEVYTLEYLRKITFRNGGKYDIYFLTFNEKHFGKTGVFRATANRWDYLGHLNGELKDRLNHYCNFGNTNCYLPRKGELCIIKHLGNWKRAVALGQKNVSCKVRLIDYGITVWADTRQIRCMIKEFLEMPALSVRCILSGIREMNKDEKNIMMAYLKEMKMSVIKGVKIVGESNGNYTMSITIPPNFEPLYPVTPPEQEVEDVIFRESAAVAITFPSEMEIGEVIAAVENCVDFDNLDMESPAYHKMQDGLLVAEVTGENCQKEARLLADELYDIFSQSHRDKEVGCVVQGKVKIIGFESQLTEQDVVKMVAEMGGCDINRVRVSTCVFTPASGKIIWVKCPVAVAVKIAKGGKIKLGETESKIEFLHRRMIRCFRCKRPGHSGAFCSSFASDKKCTRCNMMGHEAHNCRNEPFCELCHSKKRPFNHEPHSRECQEDLDLANERTQPQLYTEVWEDTDIPVEGNDNFFEFYGSN